ncbi:MAG: histidinol-phosphate transaminase [Candidatus Omnitrophota bacterium]
MNDLINPNVSDLVPYKPGKPVEELQREFNLEKVVKLASNENPSGIPNHVTQAIHDELSNVNFYPESDSYYLKKRLAEYHRVDIENVIVGAGSVELIRMIVKAFLKPGQTVLTSEKTFSFYKIATLEERGKSAYIEAPMGDDYTFDLDAIYRRVDEKTKVIFITNPNNPTGTLLPKEKVLQFIDKIPDDKIIVLDNAYQEYVSDRATYPDGIDEALNRKNIIVLRTFSKIYALSGLRVGYAISNESVISYLNRVKAPFNVTRLSQVAALASLENDDFKNRSASLNLINRAKLFRQLSELGLRTIPSETNFIMFITTLNIPELNRRLLKEGVIIRPLEGFGVPEGMRVTVGFEDENDFFIEKLTKVMKEMKS